MTQVVEDDPPGLPLGGLQAWMAAVGLDVDHSAPIGASLLAGGRSNLTYLLVDASGRRWVLRRPPLGHVMPSAHDMGREHLVLSGLNRVGFPAPQAIANCVDVDVIGAPFMLMSFVDGRVIDSHERADSISPVEAEAISAEVVETLCRLHAIDANSAGLETLGRPEGYLPRQVRRWNEQWTLSKTRELPVVDALHQELERGVFSLPGDLPWSIVHGDYRLDNVILRANEPSVAAVLDWEMSTLGDPTTDLAVALVYWTDEGDELRSRVPVAEHITDRPGFWNRRHIVDTYATTTGSTLEHLDLSGALACFKLAVIMESIRFRAMSGHQLGTAAQDIDQMGEATEALAELGMATLRLGIVEGLSQ